jgi:hypothetical protein
VLVNCVAFSPDGRSVVSGGSEGLAFIWDAATGQRLRRLQGHTNPIVGVAFSADGLTVATASGSLWNHKEQTVRLWEVLTGNERRRFVGHQAQVTSVLFAPGDRAVISGSEDGTVLVWDAAGVLKPDVEDAALWPALASDDGVTAYEAICALAARRDVGLLAGRLHPVAAVERGRIERLITNLDSEDFATRQQAEQALQQLDELAAPALRKAMEANPAPEVRRRAEALLAELETGVPSPAMVQALRAVEALERNGTSAVQQLLQQLASGAAEGRLTRAAKAALARIQARR